MTQPNANNEYEYVIRGFVFGAYCLVAVVGMVPSGLWMLSVHASGQPYDVEFLPELIVKQNPL